MIGRTSRLAFPLLLALALLATPEARAASRKRPVAPKPKVAAVLPKLVDLGADRCIPCKRMAPILVAMRKDYEGIVDVQFVDVWKDPAPGRAYGIRVIPTQIFFDRAGRERFRHEGFFGREDIERVFRDSLGVTPVPPGVTPVPPGAGVAPPAAAK